MSLKPRKKSVKQGDIVGQNRNIEKFWQSHRLRKQAHLSVQSNKSRGRGFPSQNHLRQSILRFLPRTGGACFHFETVSNSLTMCITLSYFFSIVGSSVKVYSTSTGLVVSTLSAKRDAGSHTNAITSVVLNPHNAFQLITGSLDGHIKVWDLLDGVLLQTIGVGNPVHHIAAHERWKDVVFVAVARSTKRGKANGTSSSFADFQLSNMIAVL